MYRLYLTCLALIAAAVLAAAGPVHAGKADYLALARKGWSYELRTTMLGRDLTIPVRINGRDLSGASICVVGDRPGVHTAEVLDAFRALARQVFGKPLPMRYAGPTARLCGLGRTVVIRLYSGRPPNAALSDDLSWMNAVYDFGLPPNRWHAASSPAMAQTFFGRRGQGTHLMIKQGGEGEGEDPVSVAFYRSILVEELFQSFTFGMDVVLFDRKAAFLSKLQEIPYNLRRLPWGSEPFMRTMLASNPPGLCEFDVMMMHAVARAPMDQTNRPDFIDFIDSHFEELNAAARNTMAEARFAPVLDPACEALGR